MHYELPHVKADASVEAVLNSFFVAYESISKSIYSGKALYIKDKQSVKMIDLPYDVEWNGTIVIARVPLPPASFNMYNYI